jgi:hypothetical protein
MKLFGLRDLNVFPMLKDLSSMFIKRKGRKRT